MDIEVAFSSRDQHAVLEAEDGVGLGGGVGVVGDHDDPAALFMLMAQQAENDLPVFRVKVAGRLVRQDQTGVEDQRAGDGHPLLLAAGERRHALRQQRLDIQQADQLIKILLRPVPVVQRRQQDVLPAAQRGDQVVALEDEADVLQPQAVVVRVVADKLPVEVIASAVIALDQAENVEQRGFA